MWFLLYYQPYDDDSDNLIASITQLQLFLTLWLGVMISLNDLNEESLINVDLLSVLIVGTCVAVTLFGLFMIVRDGFVESNRIFLEDKADRKERIQAEVMKRWRKAFNYASYESQRRRFGGLHFSAFNISAMIEAFRRLKEQAQGEDIALMLRTTHAEFPMMDPSMPDLVEGEDESEHDVSIEERAPEPTSAKL